MSCVPATCKSADAHAVYLSACKQSSNVGAIRDRIRTSRTLSTSSITISDRQYSSAARLLHLHSHTMYGTRHPQLHHINTCHGSPRLIFH